MPVISVHVVRKPRKDWGCASCRKPPDRAPHLVAYGYAERGDTPYRMRICMPCGSSTSGDTTIFLAAMGYVAEHKAAS